MGVRLVAAAALVLLAPSAAWTKTTILFVGNSFTYGEPAGAPAPTVQAYQPGTVTDLNGTNLGGVPALFKQFTMQAGLDYDVSLETVAGIGLDFHHQNKLGLINRRWDKVVLQSYSTLDSARPGSPDRLVTYTGLLANALHGQNPGVHIYLASTWSRADLSFRLQSPWFGKPIDAMQKTVQDGYEKAVAANRHVTGVIAIGGAWNSAMAGGLADPNPYDGITPGQLNLWAPDGYHASTYGYYLSALMQFGAITGVDPRTLGADEAAARSFNFTPRQTAALQQIAYDTLNPAAVPGRATWMLMAAGPGAVGIAVRDGRRVTARRA